MKERLLKFIRNEGMPVYKFEEKAGLSNGYIKNMKGNIGTLKLEGILNAFPNLNRQWLVTGEGEMLNGEYEEERPRISYTHGRPYYNVDFELGFVELVNDQTVNPDYLIDFAPYNTCDCWCNAHGDSMYPTISSGDILALKRIDDFRYLINGEIYAIITSNGLRTIKRVRDNGDTVTLIPDNKAIGEQTIPKSIILHIYSVKGCFKTF